MMRHLFCILLTFFLTNCSDKQKTIFDNSLVLAKVGSKNITIQDFIRRAEYTIRPKYCRRGNYIHKKIILNSLIAEKILSLEIEKNNSEKLNDINFNLFLKGRKEQAMRQLHYNNNFFEKVNLEKEEINQYLKLSRRSVQLNYINLPGIDMVKKVQYLISENITLDSIYQALWEGNTPQKNIKWLDRESDQILDVIFKDDLKVGQIIGPLETGDSSFLMMQVTGWIDQPAITESQKELNRNDVIEKLTEQSAKKAHSEWVKSLMSNKSITFNKDIFKIYSKYAGDFYLKKEDEKKEAINDVIWDQVENNDQKEIIVLDKENLLDLKSTLFSYKGNDWSVKKFHEELKSHPLVFRKKKMGKSQFPSQLRLAIADFIRNKEITSECYKLGIDNIWVVKSNVDMWRDAFLSQNYMDVSGRSEKEKLKLYNPIVDSLQSIYSPEIKINIDAFENIELSSTDMMVTQSGVPYPIVVPSFPILTDDSKLNYGEKMELSDEN